LSDINFEILIERFAGQIYNHSFRILGTREDAEEATQDVFMKIFKGVDGFRGEARLSTWIWKITVNVCLSRQRRAREKYTHIDLDESGINITDEAISSNPGKLLASANDREELVRFIRKLNEQEATVVTMFYFDEMDYKEISRVLEIPTGTVATLLQGTGKTSSIIFEKEGIKL
jgi:RNA polymerase sigma factor (sigma-70 family)